MLKTKKNRENVFDNSNNCEKIKEIVGKGPPNHGRLNWISMVIFIDVYFFFWSLEFTVA